ncbi:MAG: SDR family NAD(P)-dependent oxidoreductase [Candidatus Goldiibacteriota bacterium]
MAKKRVLITGGAGFIGSNITDELIARGYKAVIIDNLSTGLKEHINPKARFIKGDIKKADDIEKCFKEKIDVIFHIAGCASTIKSFDDPIQDLRTNVAGTVNIINAAVKHRVKRIIYASSMTAYGIPESVPVKESMKTAPISYYGITKYAGERYIMATGERTDLPFRINTTAFRMFNVYGRRQSLTNPYQGVVSIFIGNAARNENIAVFGDGKQSRDYIHISDAADAWIKAIDAEAAFGKVFNLGSGTRVSVNRLIKMILKGFGKNPAKYRINHKPARPGDQRHMQADISPVKRALKWKPKVSFENGLNDVIKWAEETYNFPEKK